MSEEGFTLIETLVALALGAMVVGAVLSTVKVAASGARRAAEASASAEAMARAGAVLQGDADHALWQAAGGGRAVFLGDTAEMVLPELPRDGGAPGLVRYRLAAEAGGTALMRDDGTELRLWGAPGALSFRFLAGDGAWRPAWTDPGLPRAFALSDGSGIVLATELPDLLPLACTRGPGADCPLPSEAFR